MNTSRKNTTGIGWFVDNAVWPRGYLYEKRKITIRKSREKDENRGLDKQRESLDRLAENSKHLYICA